MSETFEGDTMRLLRSEVPGDATERDALECVCYLERIESQTHAAGHCVLSTRYLRAQREGIMRAIWDRRLALARNHMPMFMVRR